MTGMKLRTSFMGLELKSPIVAGSCGLTSDVEKMVEMEKNGVGAVVLKSIFEEQILNEIKTVETDEYPEAGDYVRNYIRANTIRQYIDLVMTAKSRLTIPVIASINCLQQGDWVTFAKDLENAGADGIELNVFVLPLDSFKESKDVENIYYEVIKSVKSQVKIPICIKLSHNFTNLSAVVSKLRAYGADAVTLFNRFYEPDINIDTMTVGVAPVFSTELDIRTTLRWTGIVAGMDKHLEIAASSGVHSGEAAIKLLLAGATTVQVCSVMYEQGISVIGKMNETLTTWMSGKHFKSVEEFRGQLSYANVDDPVRYERAQFMKYFSDSKRVD